jgi:hypothetical protein
MKYAFLVHEIGFASVMRNDGALKFGFGGPTRIRTENQSIMSALL